VAFSVTVAPMPVAAVGEVVISTGAAPCKAAIKVAVETPAEGIKYCGICPSVNMPPGEVTGLP